MKPAVRTTIAMCAVGLALAACGGVSSGEASGSIEIADARVRAVAPGMEATAIYLDITNDGEAADELVSASVPDDIAGTVELHETVAMEDGDMGDASEDMADASENMTEMSGDMSEMSEDMSDPMDGMAGMSMRQVESIQVPADETVSLEPGGLHIMVLDLVTPMEATEVEVTLEFAEAGSITVTAPVVDNP